ncbi:MAG: hypothetical protein A2622_02020 [Bdellovibrionales bacterium RIFCSPHIGHO2_01_FULL_40_29]|nr:MAG: hypothetical protein A2622_02020 [Bdellovibrionales bacterium RIFCSPHIGHO2_01_FULL_40_29]OFZ33866.1 MAG: hypothetical protein A3D17_02440 [Bdellovibrionales bacterium RIFCSPHIGHO2_02_FULL_40_15]
MLEHSNSGTDSLVNFLDSTSLFTIYFVYPGKPLPTMVLSNEQAEVIMKLNLVLFTLLCSFNSFAGNGKIELKNSELQVSLHPDRFAGAIESIKWKNKEFINIFDHGRQLQSAIQIDGYGECHNPTEAGSSHDGNSSKTTSVLTYSSKYSDSKLLVQTQMAQWSFNRLTGACKKGLDERVKNPLSQHYLNKTIEIGHNNDPQIIRISLTFASLETLVSKNILFELLTGYLNSEFDQFYFLKDSEILKPEKFNDISGNGFPAGSFQTSSQTPIIQADRSGDYAMGIYFPQDQNKNCWGQFQGYVMYKFNLGGHGSNGNATNKWSLAYNENLKSSCFKKEEGYLKRTFEVYLVVGDLKSVHQKLKNLTGAN